MFTGIAFGPTVGGIVVRHTGSSLSVFYMNTVFHIIFAFFLVFVIPESLTESQKRDSRRQYEESLAKGKQEALDAPVLYRIKSIFNFLSPLSVLMPAVETSSSNPLKAGKKDWSLTILAASSGFSLLIMVSFSHSHPPPIHQQLYRVRTATNFSILQLCLAGLLKRYTIFPDVRFGAVIDIIKLGWLLAQYNGIC